MLIFKLFFGGFNLFVCAFFGGGFSFCPYLFDFFRVRLPDSDLDRLCPLFFKLSFKLGNAFLIYGGCFFRFFELGLYSVALIGQHFKLFALVIVFRNKRLDLLDRHSGYIIFSHNLVSLERRDGGKQRQLCYS